MGGTASEALRYEASTNHAFQVFDPLKFFFRLFFFDGLAGIKGTDKAILLEGRQFSISFPLTFQ